MATKFSAIYNRFLDKITDDLYVELTPGDTLRDMRRLLINVLPEFEFPRKNLYDYVVDTKVVDESEVEPSDFVIGTVWNEMDGEIVYCDETPEIVIDNSYFNEDLTQEEIYILAILMMNAWLQRQITSIENTRMKYSGTDFKMTS